MNVKDQFITPLDKVRDLGVILTVNCRWTSTSWTLSMQAASTNCDTRRTLAAAFVATWVDNCNTILYRL